jgi:cation diffusion facilitator family transporter
MKESRIRLFGALLSLLVGIAIMALKFRAYSLTGSTAILSDALESVVNVVAALFLLWAVRAAEAPPDEEHPYGHGKLEFVTAVFEGGLISFAAILIAYEAIASFWRGPTVPNLDIGFLLFAGAGLANGLLGFVLIQMGKKGSSAALTADGKHVLTDFYTTIGVLLGLGLVKWTGIAWIDPLIALLMAGILAFTGVPIMKSAIGGLIDAADPELLQRALTAFERHRVPGIIRMHHVRAMRNGRHVHLDGHVVVPEFWSVEKSHDVIEDFEKRVLVEAFPGGETEFHVDPCYRRYCAGCDVEPCPVRQKPFSGRPPLDIAELTSPVDITDSPKP